MRFITNSKNNFSIPVYGLGTWLMGGDKMRNPDNDDERDIGAIKMHIDSGVRFIFTAENYAEGHTEEIVGRAIKDYERESLMIATAVKRLNGGYDKFVKSANECLDRLGLDYVDVLFHHARDLETPIKETARALNTMVEEGKAKNIAVSNYSKESLEEMMEHSKYPIVINQVHYNLRVRGPEITGLRNFCRENDVILQAYRPLMLGGLVEVGKYKILDEIAEKYDRTSAQIALNWIYSQGVAMVATTHSAEHLKDNLEALTWKMEKEDLEKLTEEFPDQVEMDEVVGILQ
ncbi:aldo/keto reductase [Candidatus Dojkabacteria bacterium]|nr:aldo/keto reductase [Candidatus Dojkabacteria bacterium]